MCIYSVQWHWTIFQDRKGMKCVKAISKNNMDTGQGVWWLKTCFCLQGLRQKGFLYLQKLIAYWCLLYLLRGIFRDILEAPCQLDYLGTQGSWWHTAVVVTGRVVPRACLRAGKVCTEKSLMDKWYFQKYFTFNYKIIKTYSKIWKRMKPKPLCPPTKKIVCRNHATLA